MIYNLYLLKFKRYENIDPIITNLYQYGFGEYLVENFSFYRDIDLQIVEKDLFVNKKAFCSNALQKEVMKIISMTFVVKSMLIQIFRAPKPPD